MMKIDMIYNRKKETRIILETLRDKLFVDELEVEYNQLFFASLRYSHRTTHLLIGYLKLHLSKHNTTLASCVKI